MSQLNLEICQKIADAALASAGELKLKPICVMILDARASLRLCESGWHFYSPSPHCPWQGKCRPVAGHGVGALGDRAEVQAYFIDAVGRMMDGDFIPVPGGVLIKDSAGAILGAVGISGDCPIMMKKQPLPALRPPG